MRKKFEKVGPNRRIYNALQNQRKSFDAARQKYGEERFLSAIELVKKMGRPAMASINGADNPGEELISVYRRSKSLDSDQSNG